jgi:hypothetical protein
MCNWQHLDISSWGREKVVLDKLEKSQVQWFTKICIMSLTKVYRICVVAVSMTQNVST